MHKCGIILYWSNADDVFVAEVPELTGCTAHGNSLEEAVKNVQDAMELWIEVAEEFGDPIPEPEKRRPLYT